MMRQMLVWVLLTVASVNECCCDGPDGHSEEERIGLLNIKAWIHSGGGSSQRGLMQDWLGNDYCEWSGVVCETSISNTQRVIFINLSGARDSSLGDLCLNASLFLPFKELTLLDLSANKLADCFENQGFELLSSNLTKLEDLYLSDNKFNDSILLFLGGLSSLKFLDISGNMFTGSKAIKGLRMLEVLYLENVTMTESILLQSLGALPSLKTLYVASNNLNFITIINQGLSGLIKLEELSLNYSFLPANFLQSIGSLSALKVLTLRSCKLNGTVPTQGSYGLTKLETLLLYNCSLPEIFLQSIGSLSALKLLSLSGSKLNGSIPTQGLCKLKKLEELYLHSNNLGGLLPACLGEMSSLKVLDVSHNQFIGSIASGPLTHLTSLEILSISSNHFELPASFKPFMNHSNLRVIKCGGNKLIATETAASFQDFIPKFQLEYFSLSNCTSQALNAEIPNFLYSQHHLRFLDLSYNGFSGMFPSWLFENNTGLEQIFLKNNSFAGPFLLPFHSNFNLSVLDASNNNIHGQIPTNTCLIFPALQALIMANNSLMGSVPSCLGNMSYLNDLDLSNNQLSVVQLELLSSSSSLHTLVLSNNNLGGQMLSTFVSNSSAIPSLNVFDISNNHFSGMLPGWIGNLTILAEIDFSNNQFQGPIPRTFCMLQNLEFLDLSENYLSGFIPSCFSPPHISHVLLHKNRFSGPLTPLFYNSSSMVTLDLAYNNFVGSIPNSIGNLSMLSVLVLKANHFHGELPVQSCMLKQLSILDVSQNKLSGPLLSCLGNLTFDATSGKVFRSCSYSYQDYMDRSIVYLYNGTSLDLGLDGYTKIIIDEDVEFTTKSQYYTYKGDMLDFMSGIDLSCNKFTGEIPSEIGYLSKIHALNLSYNNLTGNIPATFSNLKQIESLDMSYNDLIGPIPLQLTELTTLEVFSVAHNNLSGKTPERKNQFGTFEASCYKGNPLLCGPPLLNSCNEAESPSQPLPNESIGEGEEDGFMDMDVFYAAFGVCYLIVVLTIAAVLCINPYWRRRWFYFIECCIDSCYYFVLDRWFS